MSEAMLFVGPFDGAARIRLVKTTSTGWHAVYSQTPAIDPAASSWNKCTPPEVVAELLAAEWRLCVVYRRDTTTLVELDSMLSMLTQKQFLLMGYALLALT